jgi:hypothetical protein
MAKFEADGQHKGALKLTRVAVVVLYPEQHMGGSCQQA